MLFGHAVRNPPGYHKTSLRQRKFADAERLLTHALSIEERLPSRPVFDLPVTLEVLAQLRKAQRREAESTQLISRAAAIQSGH